MNIQEQINKVEELEKNYLAHKYIRTDENSLESIRTFQEWHSAASVLFCEFISEEDKFLKTFVEADISGNAYVLASIYDSIHTSYKILMSKVEKAQKQKHNDISAESHGDCPFIFISHSSKDREIVKLFIDNILKKGLGLTDENIACTSFEATGVNPGDSIPAYIKHNIKGSKICLAMVSKNYKSSEVCMNEVGAAWALDKPPIQIVLPNTDFSELGWLLNTDKAAKIDDGDSLDNLMETICAKVGILIVSPKHWNPCKRDLLESLKLLLITHEDKSCDKPFLQFLNGSNEITIHPIYLVTTFGKPSSRKSIVGSDPYHFSLPPQVFNYALCPIEIELMNKGNALESVIVRIESDNGHFEAGNTECPKFFPNILQKYNVEDNYCEFDIGLCNAQINKKLDRFYIKSIEIAGEGYECDCKKNLEAKCIHLKYTISTKNKPYYGELLINVEPKFVRDYSLDKKLMGRMMIEDYKTTQH